uniref:BBS7 beta-propeller domain-containing protein n=1 Tax=Ditylenchus dipsaci TaxID=166011 RepID=A0A915D3S4_9BILA
MNVVFSRVDYAQVGTTSHGCLRVMKEHSAQANENEGKKSKKPKSCDKIIVGGQNGILLCLERKNGDTNIVYKTLQDLYIYGVDMFLCGRNSFYHFHDCVEKNSYICADQINDVLCLPITEGGWVGRGITPVIEGSHLAYEVLLNEIPNVLHLFMNDGGFNKQKVLYGTRNGKIGLVDLSPTEGIICLEIDTKSFSAVTAIDCYRILDSSGSPDVIVGKEDGLIEIYTVDELDTLNFRQLYQCEESITGMECGKVASDHFNEIVVCTYTGWVFALTTEPLVLGETAVGGRNEIAQEQQKQAPQLEVKVQQLKSELEDLENKVREERDRYQELAKSQNPNDGFVFAKRCQGGFNGCGEEFRRCFCYSIRVWVRQRIISSLSVPSRHHKDGDAHKKYRRTVWNTENICCTQTAAYNLSGNWF